MARTTLLALLVLTIGAQISLALKLRLIPKLDPEQYHKHPDSLKGGAVYVGLDLKSNRYFYDFSPIKSRNYSAVGFLREDTNSTGWAYLEITNNVTGIIPNALIPKFNDSVRAYTAGIAEGILTKHLINLHYLNILDGYCDDDPAYCKRLDKFITENIAWMNK